MLIRPQLQRIPNEGNKLGHRAFLGRGFSLRVGNTAADISTELAGYAARGFYLTEAGSHIAGCLGCS